MGVKWTQALGVGFARVAAWSDVLDRINVFPVPDGDTGRNLVISLTPIRNPWTDLRALTSELLMAARGNSGNIACRFLSGFFADEDGNGLVTRFSHGRDLAYQAVHEAKPGTMLSLFDAAVESLEKHHHPTETGWVHGVLTDLETSVRRTTEQLSELRSAGVVDAGALGMFIFCDGLFNSLAGQETSFWPIAERFKDSLNINPGWQAGLSHGYCLDVVIEAEERDPVEVLSGLGREVVTIRDGDLLKVHLHADSESETIEALKSLGHIVQSSVDDMGEQARAFTTKRPQQKIQVMTDAAGSLTRADARELGIFLLDSYINLASTSLPETSLNPADLYRQMRQGVPASTSQASVFERHQHYEKTLSLSEYVLYLCVGSVYTGNYEVVTDWKRENDSRGRLIVIDTGTASGRLGLSALVTARLAAVEADPDRLLEFALRTIQACREYIFLDKLHYLAAGGRMSRTSAFMADMFKVKPIVTPAADGATKVGVVRNEKNQIGFAMEKIREDLSPRDEAIILLQYTDNKSRLVGEVQPRIESEFPRAEVLVRPLSFTTGVHCGPGTWALAYVPGLN